MIEGCMRWIPEATVIILMAEASAELEGVARSTKTERGLRQRARIVLLAADGVASRAIGRAVGCTTGTASKGGNSVCCPTRCERAPSRHRPQSGDSHVQQWSINKIDRGTLVDELGKGE